MTRRLASRILGMLGISLTAVLLLLVPLASGCGDGIFGMDDHHRQMHGGAGGAPQTPVLSDSSEVQIEIADFDFSPRELTVIEGASITWTNLDSAPHDATDEAGAWGTGILKQGDDATLVFDMEGVYQYLCTIHPDMIGTLTVVSE